MFSLGYPPAQQPPPSVSCTGTREGQPTPPGWSGAPPPPGGDTDTEEIPSTSSSYRDIDSPPPPTIRYKVVYPYDAQLPGELTIRPGDVITVEEGDNEEDSLWWMGTNKNGHNGYFYVIFTEQLNESDEEEEIKFSSSAQLADMYSVSFEEIIYFVEDQPGDELECIICKNLPCDPHQSMCCGHTMCYNCAHKWGKRNNSCPQCRESPLEVVVDTRTKRHISSLTVYCTHYRSGCEWKGSFNTVRDHLSENCPYEDVECGNDGCTEQVQRRYLAKHMDEECSTRIVECPCCGLGNFHLPYHKLVNTHYKECPEWPMRCPNRCTIEENPVLTRSTLQDHLENNCPEQEISCQFAEAGCTVRVERKEMADHMHEFMGEHLEMLMADYLKVKSEYVKLQSDYRDVQRNHKALSKDHTALKKRVAALEKCREKSKGK